MDKKGFVRTTLYLPKCLHDEARVMAILTQTNLSEFMRRTLCEKIKQLKEQHKENAKNKPQTN